MTKREFLNAIVTGTVSEKLGRTKDAVVAESPAFEVVDGTVTVSEALIEFAKAELVKLDEKNSKKKSSTAPTKAQAENLELAQGLLTQLEVGKTYTAKEVGEIGGVSTQKATALLKALVSLGSVTVGEAKVDGRTVKAYTVESAEVSVEVAE